MGVRTRGRVEVCWKGVCCREIREKSIFSDGILYIFIFQTRMGVLFPLAVNDGHHVNRVKVLKDKIPFAVLYARYKETRDPKESLPMSSLSCPPGYSRDVCALYDVSRWHCNSYLCFASVPAHRSLHLLCRVSSCPKFPPYSQ